jgi:uncharacterized Zn finger protein
MVTTHTTFCPLCYAPDAVEVLEDGRRIAVECDHCGPVDVAPARGLSTLSKVGKRPAARAA